MEKSINELRNLVKDLLDDTSNKNGGASMWGLLLAIAGIIASLICCKHDIIFNSLNIITFLSTLFTLSLMSLANLFYYIDSRDLIKKDDASISTFYPKPFIGDNIVKVVILIILFLLLHILGKIFVNHWQLSLCMIIDGIMLGFEWSAIEFKKKFRQELYPVFKTMVFLPVLLSIIALAWILPEITQELELDTIRFSLSVSVGIGIIYYGIYLFYLSPKTQLYIKLRKCYNRLLSREQLNVEEEEKRLSQVLNGFFFDELFLQDIHNLTSDRNRIIKNCQQAYELIDYKNDYTMDAMTKLKQASQASILIVDAYHSLEKLIKDCNTLKNKIIAEYKNLPNPEAEKKRFCQVQDQLYAFLKSIKNDIDTLNIVFESYMITIDDFMKKYKAYKDCLCKYATYKKHFGKFIGCRIIPKIDQLFHRKKETLCKRKDKMNI